MTARLQHPFIIRAAADPGSGWEARCLKTSETSRGSTLEDAIHGLVERLLLTASENLGARRPMFSRADQAPDGLWEEWHDVLSNGDCAGLGKDLSSWRAGRAAVIAGTMTVSVSNTGETRLMLQAVHRSGRAPECTLH